MKTTAFQQSDRFFNLRLLFIAILIFAGANAPGAKAQGLAVYDNTNFISLTKQLTEAGKQTSNLVQMVQFLSEQKENLEKINGAIRQLQAVREITRNNQELVRLVNRDLRAILSSPYIRSHEVDFINDNFQILIDQSLVSLDFINQLLSNYSLKMNDAERARFLQEKQIESRELLAQVQMNTRRYREIIDFRAFQDYINHRNAAY